MVKINVEPLAPCESTYHRDGARSQETSRTSRPTSLSSELSRVPRHDSREPGRPPTAPADCGHERGAVFQGVAATMLPLKRLRIPRDVKSDVPDERFVCS